MGVLWKFWIGSLNLEEENTSLSFSKFLVLKISLYFSVFFFFCGKEMLLAFFLFEEFLDIVSAYMFLMSFYSLLCFYLS